MKDYELEKTFNNLEKRIKYFNVSSGCDMWWLDVVYEIMSEGKLTPLEYENIAFEAYNEI